MSKEENDKKIEIFIEDLLSHFSSHKVITYFQKLNEEGYMDLSGFINSYTKTDIVELLDKNQDSEMSSIISKLYESAKFPVSDETVGIFIDNNSKDIFTAMLLLKNMEPLNNDEKLSLIYYIFRILCSKKNRDIFIQKLLSNLKSEEPQGKEFIYADNYIHGMELSRYDIKSVGNFIEKLKEINSSRKSNQKIYFRGHSKINFFLRPSLMRSSLLSEKESVLYQELLTRCPDDFMQCHSHFEHLVKMQHYGLTTRLLDITSNPLIALYFASSANANFDGEVILLSEDSKEIKYAQSDTVSILSALCKLNYEEQQNIIDIVKTKQPNLSTSTFKKEFNEKQVILKLLHEVKTVKPAFRDIIEPDDMFRSLFVNPVKSNARIIKQDGAFILCGLDINKLNDYRVRSKETEEKIILRINSSTKENILNELDSYGINYASVFPEIDNVAKYLVENISHL